MIRHADGVSLGKHLQTHKAIYATFNTRGMSKHCSVLCLCDRYTLMVVYITPERNLACPVCQEDYSVNEEVIRLPCSHYYHLACILPWLAKVLLFISLSGVVLVALLLCSLHYL